MGSLQRKSAIGFRTSAPSELFEKTLTSECRKFKKVYRNTHNNHIAQA